MAVLLTGCVRTWCPDLDGDGFPADHLACIEAMAAPAEDWMRPRADGLRDCNDYRAEVGPNLPEVCGVNPASPERAACLDEDCDGLRDCEDPDCEGAEECANYVPGEPCRWYWPGEAP